MRRLRDQEVPDWGVISMDRATAANQQTTAAPHPVVAGGLHAPWGRRVNLRRVCIRTQSENKPPPDESHQVRRRKEEVGLALRNADPEQDDEP